MVRSQASQRGIGIGQEAHLTVDALVLYPTGEASHSAFLLGSDGYLPGNVGQTRSSAAHDAAGNHSQPIQVSGHVVLGSVGLSCPNARFMALYPLGLSLTVGFSSVMAVGVYDGSTFTETVRM